MTTIEDMLAGIESAAARTAAAMTYDVGPYEDQLLELADALDSDLGHRAAAVKALITWADGWPPGALETLQFTMHRLRWREVREWLRAVPSQNANPTTRHWADCALRAFEPDWDGRVIFRAYQD